MSSQAPLGKVRTVRLSKATDQRIEASAAQKGRTASELIRETLEAEFADARETPGQWLVRVAGHKPQRRVDDAFAKAWRKRHQ